MNAAQPFGVRARAQRAPRRAEPPRESGADAIPIRTRTRRVAPEWGIQEKIRDAERRYGMHDKTPPESSSYRVRDRVRAAAAESRRRRAEAHAASADERIPRRARDPVSALHRAAAPDPAGARAARKAKAGRRRHNARSLLFVLLLTGVFAVGVLAMVYKLIYVVSDITVEGASRYSEEEILSASGLAAGDNLYSFSSRRLASRVMLRCPYVADVGVERRAPSSVTLRVEEEAAVYYAEIYGEVRALSAGMRVLERTTAEEARARGLIRLCLPHIREAVAGRAIVFADERSARTIREVLGTLNASALRQRLSAVDCRNLYEVKMVSEGRFLLSFGGTDNMELKMKLACAVLEDEIFRTGIRASVDLTQIRSTSVVLDNQLDLDRYS